MSGLVNSLRIRRNRSCLITASLKGDFCHLEVVLSALNLEHAEKNAKRKTCPELLTNKYECRTERS